MGKLITYLVMPFNVFAVSDVFEFMIGENPGGIVKVPDSESQGFSLYQSTDWLIRLGNWLFLVKYDMVL